MLRRLANVFRARRLDAQLDEEVRSHLELLEADFRERGMTAEEARSAARREFGAIEPMKETYRDRRGIRWLDDLLADLRYALRGLRRNPGFATAAILSLALGIGLNASVFALFHALLIRYLPVERPQDLVSLYRLGGWGEGYMSYPLYKDLRDQTDVFDGVLARSGIWKVRMGDSHGGTQFVEPEYVSGNYFELLGVQAAVGRVLSDADAKAKGSSPVAVLSYDTWKNRFALDPGILGRAIVIDGRAFTVVGVAQPGFSGVEVGYRTDVWLPLTMSASTNIEDPGMHWLWAIARKKPGVSDAKIQAEANTVISRYLAEHYGKKPDSGFKHMAMGQRIEVRPGGIGLSLLRKDFEQPLRILMGAVILVLLVACANVAGLMLARGAARRREIAVRLSIGAGRWRLVRQWLTESAVIAAAGASLGLLVAAWASRAAAALLPGGAEGYVLPVDAGGPVLGCVAAVATGAALFFGVISGLGVTRIDLAQGLSNSGARTESGRLRIGIRRGLVLAQVALSVVLVVTAALFARNLYHLKTLDLGFRNYDVLSFYLDFPRSYKDADAAATGQRLISRLRSAPGVLSASAGFPGPYEGGHYSGDLFVPGIERRRERMEIGRQRVQPQYFVTIGSPPLSGREFDEHDIKGGRKVAVVNQAFAREFFGGLDPVGRSLGLNADGPADVTIVGLIRDMQHNGIRDSAAPLVYVPEAQEENGSAPLYLVRGSIPPGDLLQLVRRELTSIDGSAAIERVQTLRQRIDDSIFRERMLAGLSVLLGALAVGLAAVGLYGVMSYVVTRRTGEIGVRMALGAGPRRVLWTILREGLAVVVLGIVIGVPGSVVAARISRTLLFGIRPADPVAIGLSLAILLGAGAAATLIPARRASRVDPARALRTE